MTATVGGESSTPRLELRNITKSYPAVMANDHARADAGEMLWNGTPVAVSNPAEARRLGIAMVFQHFSLFETLTVAENIALAVEGPFDLEALAARIDSVSERYGLPLDPRRDVPAPQQQRNREPEGLGSHQGEHRRRPTVAACSTSGTSSRSCARSVTRRP